MGWSFLICVSDQEGWLCTKGFEFNVLEARDWPCSCCAPLVGSFLMYQNTPQSAGIEYTAYGPRGSSLGFQLQFDIHSG